ncbi:MAG: DUF58 domain-containing protein [Rhodobacteraceae bacterium]|nr:DUF58 domain-containing protein [Paracoccaceae bacterium]
MNKPRPSADLRAASESIAATFPALMVEASRLAASVAMGDHGRRRAGVGEDFWQYRQALPGDDLASIDWRRSGRSDTAYVREREWEAAHTIAIWADTAQSMDYSGKRDISTKGARANLLAMALSVLLSKAGERIAYPATIAATPRSGERHLQRIALAISAVEAGRPEYGSVPEFGDLKAARSIFLSDFMGADGQIFPQLKSIAERAGTGCLIHILDDTEETFPFDGRVIFESMGGGLSFETHRANSLQDEYRDQLAKRCAALEEFARQAGWQYLKHHTSSSPRAALLWLHMAIGGQR